ncbi:FecR domain-containing protein [Porticoccaceae bacterium LTM1]|nr:FecR domain-containing protein [Porticoccaceae bacterium LTM1]
MIHLMKSHARVKASRGLARLWSGRLSANQAEALNPWDSEDSDYREELVTSFHLMADIEALSDDEELLSLVDFEHARKKSLPYKGMLASASVMLAVATVFWMQKEPLTDSAEMSRYTTRIGEVKTVELSDGSQLSLNTGTEVLVTMAADSRRVILTRGEAYFDVARDEEKPFSVDVGMRTVTVLGTEFNVRKYPENFQISVTEGMVAIHSSEEAPSSNAALLDSGDLNQGGFIRLKKSGQIRVAAGWTAEVDPVHQVIEGYVTNDAGNIAMWRSGSLEFTRQPLYQVVAELNRYSGKKILIEDSDIVDLKVSAVFDVQRIDRALQGLEGSMPIKITHYFDRVVINKSKQN